MIKYKDLNFGDTTAPIILRRKLISAILTYKDGGYTNSQTLKDELTKIISEYVVDVNQLEFKVETLPHIIIKTLNKDTEDLFESLDLPEYF